MTARMTLVAVLLALGLSSVAPGGAPVASEQAIEPADLVLRGGRIVTLDELVPEAQALAARGGRLVAVGSDADVERY
ncbi:MAG TPA: hypothetical protein VMM93_13080, partial [Vicinamibacterales bacterium]|nr:hypothetical protein [Vicinamibacterales bacterium]